MSTTEFKLFAPDAMRVGRLKMFIVRLFGSSATYQEVSENHTVVRYRMYKWRGRFYWDGWV